EPRATADAPAPDAVPATPLSVPPARGVVRSNGSGRRSSDACATATSSRTAPCCAASTAGGPGATAGLETPGRQGRQGPEPKRFFLASLVSWRFDPSLPRDSASPVARSGAVRVLGSR